MGHMTIQELEAVLQDRRRQRPEGSYSATLFADPELVQRKIMEEAFEVCLELGHAQKDRERITAEAADLVFHLLAALVVSDVSFDDVLEELARRRR